MLASIDSDPLHGFDPLATIPAKERKKMDRFIEFALVKLDKAIHLFALFRRDGRQRVEAVQRIAVNGRHLAGRRP
jgi:3-oxoacyl-[acyl-carrier-protein] synthase II